MHKDQKRLQAALLPVLMDRILSEGDAVAERDCTVINRLLLQGPDPLYLMETCPTEFKTLCEVLELSVEDGRSAIENAHWQGPATLLEGSGIPTNADARWEGCSQSWRCEALWLMLASMSDCTEEEYIAKMSLLERVQRATEATNKLSRFCHGRRYLVEVMWQAQHALCVFQFTTPVKTDAQGRAHTNVDHGFYVLYKAGHKVVAVHYNEDTMFWGTTQDTSLAAEGLKVDIEISPQFGIVKGGPTWESLA